MRVRIRPYLMAGMAVVAAGSISAPSAVNPLSTALTRHDTVALSAQAKPFDPLPAGLVTVPAPAPGSGPAELPKLLAEALETAEDGPSAQAGALAFPGLAEAIINGYYFVMPWVDWAVNLGIYATQWIPIVNWFTPQISIVYYTLVEPIITSAVFNTAYWVGGAIDFVQGLTNVFNDTVNAGIGFVNAEISWFLSFLPPLPPLPFFPFAALSEAVMEIQGARTSVQIEATDELTLTGASSESTESGEPGGEPTPETTEPVTAETPPTEPVTEGEEIPPTEPVVGEQAPGEPAGLPDEGEGEGEQDLDGAEEDLDPEPLNEPAEGDEDLSDDLGDDDLGDEDLLDEPADELSDDLGDDQTDGDDGDEGGEQDEAPSTTPPAEA